MSSLSRGRLSQAAASAKWLRRKLLSLINIYKEYPAVWSAKCTDYKGRSKKVFAYIADLILVSIFCIYSVKAMIIAQASTTTSPSDFILVTGSPQLQTMPTTRQHAVYGCIQQKFVLGTTFVCCSPKKVVSCTDPLIIRNILV